MDKRKNWLPAVAVALGALSLCGVGRAGVVEYAAYNDINATSNTQVNAPNVTTFGANSGGSLKDLATGTVFANVAVGAIADAGLGGNKTTQPPAGTEANTYFNGIVDLQGYVITNTVYVNDALVFTNLDTSKRYDVMIATWRAFPNGVEALIKNAASFTNATTVGTGVQILTTNVANDTTRMPDDGTIVIHYTDIVPTGSGLSGTFSIDEPAFLDNAAGTASGPGRWCAFRLEQIAVPEPASLSLLALGGLALLRHQRAR